MKNFLFFLALSGASSLSAQSVFDSLYTRLTAEVYFETGRAELSATAQAQLDTLVRRALTFPGLEAVRITAHTDSVGQQPYNETLSARRAEAVRAALTRAGLPPARIRVAAFGERRPAASNATDDGRRRNRRATVEAIATVPMATLTGQVSDRKTGQGIPALLTLRTSSRQDSIRTDSAGRYSVRLPRDSAVKVEAVAHNYFFETIMTRVYGSPELARRYKQNPDIKLAPAKPGETAVLRDFFFVGNQAVLLRRSEPELPKVLRFMQVNPDLKIEVAGHINAPWAKSGAIEGWQWDLSTNRARLVYDYLLEHGIAAERMRYKGYGNTEMLFPYRDATPEQQEQNRRVEIRVVER